MSGETKTCNKCGIEKPATNEYYNKAKTGKLGLKGDCKECQAQYLKEYFVLNKERHQANCKQYREENKEHLAQQSKQYYELHKEQIARYKKQYSEVNKEKIVQYRKKYYITHKERFALLNKQYRELHRDQSIQYSRQYHKENAELYAQYRSKNKERNAQMSRLWKRSNLDKCLILEQKRRAIKANLPANFTAEQWEVCKRHFNNRCAYCGEEKKLVQDHFVALSKGGSYTSENIIPSCQRCNSSKNNRDFAEWYPRQATYNKANEQKILSYIFETSGGIDEQNIAGQQDTQKV